MPRPAGRRKPWAHGDYSSASGSGKGVIGRVSAVPGPPAGGGQNRQECQENPAANKESLVRSSSCEASLICALLAADKGTPAPLSARAPERRTPAAAPATPRRRPKPPARPWTAASRAGSAWHGWSATRPSCTPAEGGDLPGHATGSARGRLSPGRRPAGGSASLRPFLATCTRRSGRAAGGLDEARNARRRTTWSFNRHACGRCTADGT